LRENNNETKFFDNDVIKTRYCQFNKFPDVYINLQQHDDAVKRLIFNRMKVCNVVSFKCDAEMQMKIVD
jgi:hypothetical protein